MDRSDAEDPGDQRTSDGTGPGSAPGAGGLYRASDEHDACGVGFVAHIKGRRSHAIVRHALDLLINLEHRGACGSDPEHRRWRRHPPADARPLPAQVGRASRCPPPDRTAPASCSCPASARRARRCSTLIERIVSRRRANGAGLADGADQPRRGRRQRGRGRPGLRAGVRRRGRGDGPAAAPAGDDAARFERTLYVIRKRIEHAVEHLDLRRRRPQGRSTSSACRPTADLQGHAHGLAD